MLPLSESGFSFGADIPRDMFTFGVVTQAMETAMVHTGKGYVLDGTFAANGTNKAIISMRPPILSAAAVTIDMTNANADMTYTAVTKGEIGNSIEIVHLDPDVASSPLSARVDGSQIAVSLATNGAKAITTTALALATFLNANNEVSGLISSTYESTGAGVVNAKALTALSGGTENVFCLFKIGNITAVAETVIVNMYEDATFTGTGITFTPINKNRVIRTNTRIPFTGTLAGTVNTTGATKIGYAKLRGTATGIHFVPGGRADEVEYVLCPGKRYILEFAPVGATEIDYKFYGYEITGAVWPL